MNSIFRYPGGKSKAGIRNWILAQMPASTEEYREPFVGGGGIFFNVPVKKCWINDINPGLIAVYEALNRPGFIKSCKSIKPAKPGEALKGPYNARLGRVFQKFKYDTSMDPALRYFFINRTVFGGRVNYDIPSRLYYSNPGGWNIVKTQKLELAAERLKGVQVTCGPYNRLIKEPGNNVWLYLDPPYVRNSELTAQDKLYQHSFTLENHQQLAEVIKSCKHKVCLSYDDHPLVHKLYKDFRILRRPYLNCGTTQQVKSRVTELLVMNYDR